MKAHALQRHGDRLTATLDGPWLRALDLVAVEHLFEARMADDEEALALLLGGTLDLFAGSSSWLQRGLRATVFDGRPCAVYLPPKVGFRAAGRGELLLARGKRPPAPPASPKPDRASMPLLPLAGGKAYDARTGTWEMLERFPSSPEAVLPRAIETTLIGDVRVERVFTFAFKAQTLCLDECLLGAGQRLTLPRPMTPTGVRYGEELVLFVRSEGECELTQGEAYRCRAGDSVVSVRANAEVGLQARGGRAHVVAVWAGPKPS